MDLVSIHEGFGTWYALWEDVLASDREAGQRMALYLVAHWLRRAGHDRAYLDQPESS